MRIARAGTAIVLAVFARCAQLTIICKIFIVICGVAISGVAINANKSVIIGRAPCNANVELRPRFAGNGRLGYCLGVRWHGIHNLMSSCFLLGTFCELTHSEWC